MEQHYLRIGSEGGIFAFVLPRMTIYLYPPPHTCIYLYILCAYKIRSLFSTLACYFHSLVVFRSDLFLSVFFSFSQFLSIPCKIHMYISADTHNIFGICKYMALLCVRVCIRAFFTPILQVKYAGKVLNIHKNSHGLNSNNCEIFNIALFPSVLVLYSFFFHESYAPVEFHISHFKVFVCLKNTIQ